LTPLSVVLFFPRSRTFQRKRGLSQEPLCLFLPPLLCSRRTSFFFLFPPGSASCKDISLLPPTRSFLFPLAETPFFFPFFETDQDPWLRNGSGSAGTPVAFFPPFSPRGTAGRLTFFPRKARQLKNWQKRPPSSPSPPPRTTAGSVPSQAKMFSRPAGSGPPPPGQQGPFSPFPLLPFED